MKLKQKLLQIELPASKVSKREAEKLLASGVNKDQAFNGLVRKAKDEFVSAGFDFYEARFGFEHGEWEPHCELYKQKISIRTIQRYIANTEVTIRYVLFRHGQAMKKDKSIAALTSIKEIRARAMKMELMSPREMIEVLRENGIFMKFGGYFPEDYEQKKTARLLGGQIEFDFEAADKTLQLICNPKVALPSELEKLQELEGTLKSASIRVQRQIADIKKTIEA